MKNRTKNSERKPKYGQSEQKKPPNIRISHKISFDFVLFIP